MFRKIHESLSQKTLGMHVRWGRVVVPVGAFIITAAALLMTAGSLAAEPTRSAGRDDSSLYQGDPGLSPPPRLPQPPVDNNDFPGNPSEDDSPPRPHHFRSHEPDAAPRHRLSPQERSAPAHEDQLPEREQIQRKLSSRYGNPAIIRLVRSMAPQQSLEVYLEISGLIDARHLKPSTYDARVKQAVKNLCQAIENPAFLQANSVGDDPSRLDAFRRDVLHLAEGRTINGAEDAYQALQWTMQAGERDAGLRPTAVALEFIFGATDSLDKYSAFVPAMGKSSPSAELEDHIVGIGVEIKPDERGMLIANALPGGPAAEAGLRGGDIIESINGQKVSGATLDAAVDLITGPAGSQLTLGVRRDERFADVHLVRRRVEVHSVSEVKMLENNVGYIKLEKFAQNSSEECDKALWDLYRQGMKSLIVDVRGNPGGLLTTAIQLSNKFVPSGTIVATRGRDASDNTVEYAHRERTWKTPLVVLVDENSASASEIFAAAVQENGRGLVVGRRTYGKGTVQTHFPLQSVRGNLRLTTAQFFSPTGRTMAGAGVEPDVDVEAEHMGRHAYYEREAPSRHEAPYEHEPSDEHEGFRQHEAAYRHGAPYGPEASHGPNRDIAAALEVATSQQVFDLAQAAGNRRDGNAPSRPEGR
ncbi:MAG TPA: S41 family peptidase [Planctomycetaceae bacterium]|jgi:carboxyl-terminal processing protease|nr:S41 family peptidase [Planctomycetaceae bacterium]